ncbi:MAG TPA: hypothetical protein VLD19_21740, partial [Chitinophagaceae bacterium]|nr:hypothetical protein [Chitinophagaceae bacterium]
KTFPTITSQQITTVDIQMTSPSTAWMSTSNGLFKSTDTCNTWNKMFPPAINGLFFFNNNEGILYNSSSQGTSTAVGVYHTSDGAASWQPIGSPSENAAGNNIIQFTDKMHGWFSQTKTLYGTGDGGVTWQAKFSGSYISDVQFLDSQTGYVASSNEIYKTTDGGQTWVRNCKIGKGPIWEIFFLDANTGWACCYDGAILRLKQ